MFFHSDTPKKVTTVAPPSMKIPVLLGVQSRSMPMEFTFKHVGDFVTAPTASPRVKKMMMLPFNAPQ